MTRAHFDVQIGRLIVLKGWPDDVEEYFAALKDVADPVFTAACDYALRTRTWFPVPAELRADCDVVRVRVTVEPAYPAIEPLAEPKVLEIANPLGGPPLRITITREWKHDCDTCADTGWSSRQCPDTGCGRKREHGAHEFVEPCHCREWNPTIRRRREAAMTYAQTPGRAA